MKPITLTTAALRWTTVILASVCSVAYGESYSLSWYKISGGGGASSNGEYSLSSTLGQPDASPAMKGGEYSLNTGFWSLVGAVQTAGLPNLAITQSGNSVVISWPGTNSYTLQQNASLSTPAAWSTTAYSVSTVNGTNSITITTPSGYLFFRLKSP